MLILVRHGHAGEKSTWRPREDGERPLSALGEQQAAGIVRMVAPWAPARIVSSPYLRCRQTVTPLARRLGLGVTTDTALAPDADLRALVPAVPVSTEETLVVCTHGETIAALLERWQATGSVRLPEMGRPVGKGSTEKGALWMVLDDGDGPVAHYVPPLLVDPLPLGEPVSRPRSTAACC